MLSGSGIGIELSGEVLFSNATFQLNAGECAGLAGRNGAGKSTLLRVIAGERKADLGTLSIVSGTRIGYLKQDIKDPGNTTVLQEALSAFKEISLWEARVDEIVKLLETETKEEKVMDLTIELHELHERLRLANDNQDKQAELILFGLGFKRNDLNRQVSEFSGGWRMRIELARLLLQDPDLLLLDEPTNHLDIEAIAWLEKYLSEFRGGVVLVSHDKTFLNRLCTHTWEVTPGKLYVLKGNYSRFMEWKQELIEHQKAERKNQEKYVEHTKELINKFRAKKNKAAFAQSLIHKLEKFEMTDVDEMVLTNLNFRFPPAPPSGKLVMEGENISKHYGDKLIFRDHTFAIGRGEKIALVGKNGEGKTTFTKILTGETDYEGMLRFGHNVKPGYFAQDQHLRLDPKKTVFQTVDDIAEGDIRTRLRDMLGMFLFSGDDIDKKVGVLSGGEKSRLALCCLMLEPSNLLILDEPTHHLDIPSIDMLKRALVDYAGTLIIVSHDRDFLDGLTNRVFEFRDQQVRQLHGTVKEFLALRKQEVVSEQNLQKEEKQSKNEKKKAAETKPERQDQKELKKLQSRFNKLEQDISRLENDIATMEKEMSEPEVFQKKPDLLNKYQETKSELERKMEEWEKLGSQLDD